MSSPILSRRRFLASAAAATLVAALPDPAMAGRSWCRTDPAGSLDKMGFQVYLSSPAEYWEQNDSSGDIVIQHPKDVKTRLVWVDPSGYFGQGVSTNFATNTALTKSTTSMEVQIKVYIPATTNTMPVLVEWAPGKLVFGADGTPLYNPVLASVEGVSNSWITLRSTLPYQ